MFAAACATRRPPPTDEPLCSDGAACVTAALRYENADGVELDLARAAGLYERACTLGSAHGCGSYGVLRFYGHGVPADPMAGKTALERGCEGNYGQACANLGIIHALGRSAPRDLDAAARLFDRGCVLGAELGCRGLCDLCETHRRPSCDRCESDPH